MRTIIMIIILGLMIGCSSTRNSDKYYNLPALVEQEELPALPPSITTTEYRIKIRMQIDEKGEVTQAYFLKGSGEAEWDSIAIQSIKKWKFDPIRVDDKPVKMWIDQIAIVKAAKPFYLSLAEIVCDSYEKANIIFSKLEEGKDFGRLASEFSSDPSGNKLGVLGKMDVNTYPASIRSILKKLEVGQYTSPLEYKKMFVIFKRIKN